MIVCCTEVLPSLIPWPVADVIISSYSPHLFLSAVGSGELCARTLLILSGGVSGFLGETIPSGRHYTLMKPSGWSGSQTDRQRLALGDTQVFDDRLEGQARGTGRKVRQRSDRPGHEEPRGENNKKETQTSTTSALYSEKMKENTYICVETASCDAAVHMVGYGYAVHCI